MIIGIGGELESGKSTIAEIFVNKYKFTELSFAKNLKQMCRAIFELTDHQVNTTEGKKELFIQSVLFTETHADRIFKWITQTNQLYVDRHVYDLAISNLPKTALYSPRAVLQFVGTEVLRNCVNQDFHVRVIAQIIKGKEKWHNFIISDARFENERKWITEQGGRTVMAYNPQSEPVTENQHQSEMVGKP